MEIYSIPLKLIWDKLEEIINIYTKDSRKICGIFWPSEVPKTRANCVLMIGFKNLP